MGETDLYYPASPTPYAATKNAQRGFLLAVGKGAGNVDYSINGIAAPYCTYIWGIGMIEESSAIESALALSSVETDVDYIINGELVIASLPIIQEGFQPLRNLYVSEPLLAEVPGGKTLYSVEVVSNCEDSIYVAAAARNSYKDPFRATNWQRIWPYSTRAGVRTSGIEFRIMVFVLGGGRFEIKAITAWFKLTDRRGFHTQPGGKSGGANTSNNGA